MTAVPPTQTSVVISGRKGLLLEGIGHVIDAEPDLVVSGIAGDGEESARLLRQRRPDVVVKALGDRIDVADVERVFDEFRDASGITGVVIMLTAVDPFVAKSVIDGGADACITRDAPVSALADAIRYASRHEPYIETPIALSLARISTQGGACDLTTREYEVLRLIALGHTNREISSRLYLSVRTIETHRARIQAKLGTDSRADLVSAARDFGLLG